MQASTPLLRQENMTLHMETVLQAAYTTLIQKDYNGHSSRGLSVIVSLTRRLQRRINPFIGRALRSSGGQLDGWAALVLNPVLDEFDSAEALGVSIEDAEYMVLLGTVLILAWELSYLYVASPEIYSINTFLMKMLGDYLCEPEVCRSVAERLKTECDNLERIAAGPKVVQAVWAVRNMLPDQAKGTATWDSYKTLSTSMRGEQSSRSNRLYTRRL